MELKSLNDFHHQRIIPVKFGEILPSSLGGGVLSKLLTDNGWINADNGRYRLTSCIITKAHLEPTAQVS